MLETEVLLLALELAFDDVRLSDGLDMLEIDALCSVCWWILKREDISCRTRWSGRFCQPRGYVSRILGGRICWEQDRTPPLGVIEEFCASSLLCMCAREEALVPC